jgi:diguanylate cyclase (GGDEF)-like protein
LRIAQSSDSAMSHGSPSLSVSTQPWSGAACPDTPAGSGVDWVRARCTELAYAQQPLGIATNAVVALLPVVFVWDLVGVPRLLLWAATFAAVTALRLAAWRAAMRNPEFARDPLFGAYHTINSALTGAAWGSSVHLLEAVHGAPEQWLIVLALTGVTSGALTILGARFTAYAVYLLCSLPPLAVWFLLQGDRVSVVAGLLGLVYLGALLLAGRRYHQVILDSLGFAFEKQQTAETLSDALHRLERSTGQLEHQARHDPLTGLLNRCEFDHAIERAIASAREEGQHHVLLYLDLDQFKVVNDSCGHLAGDELLRQVAATLARHVRAADVLARLGGDEFGVLLSSCPAPRGLEIASGLCQAVKELRFAWEGRPFTVGASIGAVEINAEAGTVASLLSAADLACYAAKDFGRGRVHLYQADDAEVARRRGELHSVSEITSALEAPDRFVLYRQPIVAIQPGEQRPPRYEILLRMHDCRGGLLLPGAFLPAAERYNLSARVDRFVVRTLLARLRDGALPRADYAINLSALSLADPGFLDFIRGEIARSGVEPARLMFEITETAAIAHLAHAVHFVREMRTLGCRFALDDFGSGVSSFGYLKALPLDALKIDGQFVRDMLADRLDAAVVESVQRVGRVLGIATVAEFVETAETLEALRALGVDEAQGAILGGPEPLPVS